MNGRINQHFVWMPLRWRCIWIMRLWRPGVLVMMYMTPHTPIGVWRGPIMIWVVHSELLCRIITYCFILLRYLVLLKLKPFEKYVKILEKIFKNWTVRNYNFNKFSTKKSCLQKCWSFGISFKKKSAKLFQFKKITITK